MECTFLLVHLSINGEVAVGFHYARTMIFLAKLIFYVFSLKPLDFGNAKLLESPSRQGEALYPLKTLKPLAFWYPGNISLMKPFKSEMFPRYQKAKGFRVSRDRGLPLAGWGFQEVWHFQNPRVFRAGCYPTPLGALIKHSFSRVPKRPGA